MTRLETTEMVVPKTDPIAMAPRTVMTAATGTATEMAADANVGTLLKDIVRALLAKLPHGVMLEVTAVDAGAKAGIETGTTHADIGTVITIVDDAGDPARAQDPLAGDIVPEMTEIVGTVVTAPTAETAAKERIDLAHPS